MSSLKALITDYAWPDLEVERAILGQAGIEVVEAASQDEPTLRKLAADVQAIMTCWAEVPASVIGAAPDCKLVSRLGIGLDNGIHIFHRYREEGGRVFHVIRS